MPIASASGVTKNQVDGRIVHRTRPSSQLVVAAPKPRVNLRRFHGVFAANSRHRAMQNRAERGKGSNKHKDHCLSNGKTPAERIAVMSWAQRLKRVFQLDIEACEKRAGSVRIIACMEDPAVIRQILEQVRKRAAIDSQAQLPPERAPPQLSLFKEA